MENVQGNVNNTKHKDNKPLQVNLKLHKEENAESIAKKDTALRKDRVIFQKCVLPSFGCYLEEAETFNQHLTDLAQHTAW